MSKMKTYQMDDAELWAYLKSGKQEALKEIYDRYLENLENYGKKFTQDITLIEDTIHDIFVLIWQKKDNLGQTDSIVKYLCVSLRRELIRRVGKSMQVTGLEHVENQHLDFSVSIEDMLIDSEVKDDHSKKLQTVMTELSGRQKEAIYLRYYEEMSYEEICEIMDINYQSVRNLISKGILEMRKHFLTLVLISILGLYFN